MYSRIIAAVDGSEHSLHALERAGVLAHLNKAVLTLVHITPNHPVPEELKHFAQKAEVAEQPDDLWSAVSQGILARAREHVSATVAKPPQMETERREGDIAEALLDAAHDSDAELIVVGNRGLSRVTGLMMGSVSQKLCAAESETDILIVK